MNVPWGYGIGVFHQHSGRALKDPGESDGMPLSHINLIRLRRGPPHVGGPLELGSR